jgi:murein endopeptidase
MLLHDDETKDARRRICVHSRFSCTGGRQRANQGQGQSAALPTLAKPDDPATPAKELFGRRSMPAPVEARVIGFYSKGCLAGAKALPINGKTWQAMRLSRNRNWGHPSLVQFLERLADTGPKVGWRGLLVGDLSQARGGPMLTGHSSQKALCREAGNDRSWLPKVRPKLGQHRRVPPGAHAGDDEQSLRVLINWRAQPRSAHFDGHR